MSSYRFLVDAGAVILAAGVFLTLYNILLTGVEIVVKTCHRIFVSRAGRRLRDMDVIQEKPYQAHDELDWKRLVLWIATPGFALVVHDFILSMVVLMIGIAILARVNFRQK